MIGLEHFHKDRLKPEFLPAGENFGVQVEIYPDETYGAIAKVYKWERFSEVMWGKRHREFAKLPKKEQDRQIAEDKKRWDEYEKNPKPVDTSNWVYPNRDDMKRMIACNIFFAYLTSDEEIRNRCIGKIQALTWATHSHQPPEFKHAHWSNYWITGISGNQVKSLEGVIEELKGTAMTSAKSISLRLKGEEDPLNIRSHEDFLAYAKVLETQMIKIMPDVRDE